MSDQIEIKQGKAAGELYHQDFYSWTQQQAELLKAGKLHALDVANILEEIETLGRSERASLKSSYRLICSHLLKMKHQAERYTRSWYNTVDRERGEIVDILAENPGLRPSRQEIFEAAYALARKDAARETGLALRSFQESPAFTLAECEDTAFLPKELRELLDARRMPESKRKGTGKAE